LNQEGEKVSSGVYYYTLQAGEFRAMKNIVIVPVLIYGRISR
jgi:hypothetical protein